MNLPKTLPRTWRPVLVLGTAFVAASCLGGLSFVRGAGAFCDLDSPCIDEFYCKLEDHECLPKGDVGAECDRDVACFDQQCVDSVCCASACDNVCQACNLPGSTGGCSDVPAGTDPFNGCPGTTACGQNGTCQASAVWSRSFGDGNAQHTTSIAVGPINEIVFVGSFSGTIDFGSDTPLSSNDGEGALAAKLDSNGGVLWTRSFVGDGTEVATDVWIDRAANSHVVGWFDDTIGVNGDTFTTSDGLADGFVTKLDAGGNPLWSHPFVGDGDQRLLAVAVDPDGGDVFVGGSGSGDVSLETCNIPDAPSGALIVARLSSQGDCLAMEAFGSSGKKRVVDLALDQSGALIVGAVGSGSVDFGDGLHVGATSDEDIFIAKLHPDLRAIWSRHMGGIGDDRLGGIAVGDSDDIWLAGSFETFINFGQDRDEALTSAAERDIFIAQLNPFGSHILSERFGDKYDQEATTITERDGELLVGGRFQLSVDFGNGALSSDGGFDAFVTKLDSELRPRWSLPLGGAMDESLAGVRVDGRGDILFAGDYEHTVQLDVLQTSAGQSDIFVAQITP